MSLNDKEKHKKKQQKAARRKIRLEKISSKRKAMVAVKQNTRRMAHTGFSRHAWNNTGNASSTKPVLTKKVGFDKQAWNDERA